MRLWFLLHNETLVMPSAWMVLTQVCSLMLSGLLLSVGRVGMPQSSVMCQPADYSLPSVLTLCSMLTMCLRSVMHHRCHGAQTISHNVCVIERQAVGRCVVIYTEQEASGGVGGALLCVLRPLLITAWQEEDVETRKPKVFFRDYDLPGKFNPSL